MAYGTRSSVLWGGLLLVAITVVAFSPVLRAGFVWDDDVAITENPLLREPGGWLTFWTQPHRIPQHHYWPLLYTTFWVDYQIWGLNPFGYHVTNLVLHVFNVILLWAILRRAKVRASGLAAAVFALHPIHVESVAWAIERKDVLSGAFYLLSALFFIVFRERHRARWYVLSLATFACGLFTKSMVVSLPLAILIWIWWKEGRITRKDILSVGPLLVMAALVGAFDLTVSRAGIWPLDLSPVDRLLVATRVVWFYLGKLFWPTPLMAHYPKWEIDAESFRQLVYPVITGGVLVALFALRNRIGRGLLAGFLYFVVTLGPVLGIVDHGFIKFSFVADHFLYLPSIGPILLGAAGLDHLGRSLRVPQLPRVAFGCFLLGALGILTWHHTTKFHDRETLFRDNLNKNPRSFVAHHQLGSLLANRGEEREAIHHFRESIRAEPSYVQAYNGLGYLLARQGKLEDAAALLEKAVDLNPAYADAHHNLGIALVELGDPRQAVRHFRRATELNPRDWQSSLALAEALLLDRRFPEALAEYERLIRLTPDNPLVHMGYADALARVGRVEEAEVLYGEAIRLDPRQSTGYLRLARFLFAQGRWDESLFALGRGMETVPGDARFPLLAGQIHQQKGEADDAIREYRKALSIDPGLRRATTELAWILATHPRPERRDPDQALTLAQDAVRDAPSPRTLDVLSAALAAGGQFEQAVLVAEKALELAREKGDADLAVAIEKRLQGFREGRPFQTAGPK